MLEREYYCWSVDSSSYEHTTRWLVISQIRRIFISKLWCTVTKGARVQFSTAVSLKQDRTLARLDRNSTHTTASL